MMKTMTMKVLEIVIVELLKDAEWPHKQTGDKQRDQNWNSETNGGLSLAISIACMLVGNWLVC